MQRPRRRYSPFGVALPGLAQRETISFRVVRVTGSTALYSPKVLKLNTPDGILRSAFLFIPRTELNIFEEKVSG